MRYFDKNAKTVDVGGGNGYTTAVAKQKGFDMSLLELSEGACKNAMKRGIDAHAGMLTKEYLTDGEYKQVLLLDVLEHIEDDNGFLGLLHRKIHGATSHHDSGVYVPLEQRGRLCKSLLQIYRKGT